MDDHSRRFDCFDEIFKRGYYVNNWNKSEFLLEEAYKGGIKNKNK